MACVSLAALIAARPAAAQTVQADISSSEAFIGELISVEVTVSNMSEKVAPIPPQTKDFEITADSGNPIRRGQRVSIVNNRRTDSMDYTYRYDVKPLRPGRLVLPPFEVQYHGQVYHTQQFPITATKDLSTSLLLCEIKAPAETVYVGQPVNLTLEVWIQKFSQGGSAILDGGAMWSPTLRNAAATSLGVFTGAEVERIRYGESKRKDQEGIPQDYFVYRIETTVYPRTPGPFDFGEIAFAYNYPVRLGRDFFNYRLERVRRLRVAATAPTLTVKALPSEGRPPDFNGAVGAYSIRTWAKPTEVPAGDPITLNLEIQGDGPLDRLNPPKLDQVPALVRDFEISGESLAGTVEGNRKLFSQTIRALHENVAEIPPIPMSFFNATTGQYETSWSQAIPLTVKPAQRIAVTDLPLADARSGLVAPLTETTEGLLANEDRPNLLLAEHAAVFGPGSWVLLGAMPLAYLGAWFIQRRAARFRDDEALRRRSRAYATAKKRLHDGDSTPPAAIRAAVLGYIADRCGVPAGGLTRAEAIRLLSERRIPAEKTRAVDGLLESLELAEYGGGGAIQDAASAAKQVLNGLEQCRLR